MIPGTSSWCECADQANFAAIIEDNGFGVEDAGDSTNVARLQRTSGSR